MKTEDGTIYCKYCGSIAVEYKGISDGGGAYGDSVCDQWECMECMSLFDEDCLDAHDYDDSGKEWM